MSQNRRTNTRATYDRNTYSRGGRGRSEYVYGSAVRKVYIQEEAEEIPVRRQAPAREQSPRVEQPAYEVRKNREKAHHMSLGYVFFLTLALSVSTIILVNYVRLEADLTKLTKSVASKEVQLSNLKETNDATYNRIINSVDLEEVRRIAIEELGMVYAAEDQIVVYEHESRDYMRRVTDKE